jgi:hypothetical protein
MTVMTTAVGPKIYEISWEHPWRTMDFRGEMKTIKVTNCAITINLGKDPEIEKPKILGHGIAKWPIEAMDAESEHPGRHSRLLLKGEHLGKDKARRIALTRALASAKLDKATRTKIWETYFQTFKSVRKVSPPTPVSAMLADTVQITNPYAPKGNYIMRNPGIVSYVLPASNWTH